MNRFLQIRIDFDHCLEAFIAEPRLVALRKLMFSFQAVAIKFTAKSGYPGTGGLIISLLDNLRTIWSSGFIFRGGNKRFP